MRRVTESGRGDCQRVRKGVFSVVGYPTKEHEMSPVNEYDAKIDVKKRVTLRGARYAHYHVQEYKNGRIVLEPRELVKPFPVSRRTLKMMDASVANMKKGVVSDPIDLPAVADDE